jgi:hypothetical protein
LRSREPGDCLKRWVLGEASELSHAHLAIWIASDAEICRIAFAISAIHGQATERNAALGCAGTRRITDRVAFEVVGRAFRAVVIRLQVRALFAGTIGVQRAECPGKCTLGDAVLGATWVAARRAEK